MNAELEDGGRDKKYNCKDNNHCKGSLYYSFIMDNEMKSWPKDHLLASHKTISSYYLCCNTRIDNSKVKYSDKIAQSKQNYNDWCDEKEPEIASVSLGECDETQDNEFDGIVQGRSQ